MRTSSKGAIIACAGAVLLGTSLALSSVSSVSSAPQGPAAKSKGGSCKSSHPCFSETNSSDGSAIAGVSNGEGQCSNGASCAAVAGSSTYQTGTSGGSTDGYGVLGLSGSNYGVYGYSAGSAGGYFGSDMSNKGTGSAALMVEGLNSYTNLLNVYNQATGASAYIAYDGVAAFSNDVYAPAFITDLRTRDGEHVGSFSAQSTRATIEETGTAQLANGEGSVRFGSAFAQTVNLHNGYQVFLTPDGDTRGLYVAKKYEAGFIVRENEHGRSSVDFDYRVVAHPVGSSDMELPRVDLKLPVRGGITQHP